MTFLALDVGNTRLKWAQYDSVVAGAKPSAQGAVFLENIDKLAEGDWSAIPAPTKILGCIVAGDAIKRRVVEQMELWDVTARWVVPGLSLSGSLKTCRRVRMFCGSARLSRSKAYTFFGVPVKLV